MWLSELTHSYWHLSEHGIEVAFFSPNGGEVSYTPFSDPFASDGTEKNDLVSRGFLGDAMLVRRLKTTRPIGEASHEDYAAIHIAGGMGATFDLFPNDLLGHLIEDFWSSRKNRSRDLPWCNRSCEDAKDSTSRNQQFIVNGRRVNHYSVREDEILQLQRGADKPLVPHYPQTVLEKVGGRYEAKGIQQPHVVQDGRLLSGQNQQSATDYGIRLRDMLLETK